jgi:hypothetical protein
MDREYTSGYGFAKTDEMRQIAGFTGRRGEITMMRERSSQRQTRVRETR